MQIGIEMLETLLKFQAAQTTCLSRITTSHKRLAKSHSSIAKNYKRQTKLMSKYYLMVCGRF